VSKVFVISGALLILLGLICNAWVFFWLVDNTLLDNPPNRVFIWVFDIALIALGIAIIKFKARFLKNLVPLALGIFFSLILFVALDAFLGYKILIAENSDESDQIQIENVNIPDDKLGWKPKPNATGTHKNKGVFDVTYVFDEHGFKTVDNQGDADFSLFFFGDSYTFGQGVTNADTFPNILADEYLADSVHVFNAGVMGYGIPQMVQRFLDVQNHIQPGDVVVFTPLSRDIERNLKDFMFPAQFIFKDSIIKVENYPYFNGDTLQAVQLDTPYNRIKALLFYAPFSGNNTRFLYRLLTRYDTTADAQKMLNTVKSITEAKGAHFVLIFLPRRNERINGYDVDISGFDYLDIMPFYPSKKADLNKLKIEGDGHWNRLGHEITARAILETLRQAGIVDSAHLKYSTQPVSIAVEDQLRLAQVSRRQTASQLLLDLAWQGITRPHHDYTIFAQLLDANQQRVSGIDELPPWPFTTLNPNETMISHHAVPLPEQPGTYHILLGLYYFKDDQLVNVGAVTLDQPVTVH